MTYVGPRLDHLPIVGICGESGSGKTALIARLVERAQRKGWMVLVVDRDREVLVAGSGMIESDPWFSAGADVLCRDGRQTFVRTHGGDGVGIEVLLRRAAARYDLVLVEDHAVASLPTKIWLRRNAQAAPPVLAGPIALDLLPSDDREEMAFALIERALAAIARDVPLYGVVLLGDRNEIIGEDVGKVLSALSPLVDATLLAGPGTIPADLLSLPRLTDVPGKPGPLGGMVAALRWQPRARFVFVACDMPNITTEMLSAMLAQMHPGVLGIMGQREPHLAIEPFPCVLDGRMGSELEFVNDPSSLVLSAGLGIFQVPTGWHGAFQPPSPMDSPQSVAASG